MGLKGSVLRQNSVLKTLLRRWLKENGTYYQEVCRTSLRSWASSFINGTRPEIGRKRKSDSLEERLNNLYSQDPTDEILAEILDVQLGLNLETGQEKVYWEQRANINWLKNGDRNKSFFFHKIAVQRYNT